MKKTACIHGNLCRAYWGKKHVIYSCTCPHNCAFYEPNVKVYEWRHEGSHWANRWICSRCGYKLFGNKTNFCPHCGGEMEVNNDK